MKPGVAQWPKPPLAWGPLVAEVVPVLQFWVGGKERGTLLLELSVSLCRAGRCGGRHTCSAAFTWGTCRSHVTCLRYPSVKWGEARE